MSRLVGVRAIAAARWLRRPGSPAELARRLDPSFRVTPTIRLLSDVAVRLVTQPDQRDVINTPPRTGKSQLMIWTVVWALMQDPDLPIVLVAYADELAQEHSRKARRIIQEHHEYLGFRLSPDKTAVGRWTVEGRAGGLLAAGINSGVTGHGASLLFIDDPVKDQAEADSAAHRRRVLNEYRSTLSTRVHPGGGVCVIQCMTGDTPVLRPDGSETPLRDIRAGDRIATYEDGGLGVSTVRNWANQGGDQVFAIRLESGRSVRANARHPFLVVSEGGAEVWRKAVELRPGDRVVALTAASSRSTEKACAKATTRPCGELNARGASLSARGMGAARTSRSEVSANITTGCCARPSLVTQLPAAMLTGVTTMSRLEACARTTGLPCDSPRPASVFTPRATRGGGKALSVPVMGASDRWYLRGSALRTTTSRNGQMGFDMPRLKAGRAAQLSCVSGTGSTTMNTIGSLMSRAVGALSAVALQKSQICPSTGADTSVLITATTPMRCADCSAMTATSRSGGCLCRNTSGPPLSTYRVGVDEVLEVVPCGVEDVFDIQVDRTENFIANGVVSHNTRWHERDLAGELLAGEPDRWRHTNVPAIAAAGVPDALGRGPGVAMVSALGFTAEHFVGMRRSVGERTWNALYQGVPRAPEGGLVKGGWLDSWRLPVAPQSPVRVVVGVDPSDSGSGDSCGIVAASLGSDGVVAVVADVSAPMTSDEWAREAVALAVAVGASEIAVEGFAARETYLRVVREALARARVGRAVAVSAWPPKGRARVGDSVARSASLLQGLEVGLVRVAGHLPGFEQAAVGWQLGQHQPDSLAALVVAHDVLVSGAGRGMGFSGVPSSVGSVVGLDWASRRVG